MTTFKKFNSIVQYSGVVKSVKDNAKYNNTHIPKLKFKGSVKIHGTNSCIGLNPDGEIWFQSRERILSYEADNAGFYTWGVGNKQHWIDFYNKVTQELNLDHDNFYIFGEWFGSSIQKGVAVAQLPEKKFGIFEMVITKGEESFVLSDIEQYHEYLNSVLPNVVVIDAIVPPLELDIDFNEAHLVQNYLLETALKVEEECPVGKFFGVSGIGEGVVYTCVDKNIPKFKIKGTLHQSSKVTTLRELSEAEVSAKKNAADFVESFCSVNRMEQGISKLEEMGLPVVMQSMGAYLRWLFNDIITEGKDVLEVSFIERKDVSPLIANKGRNWFIDKVNEISGLSNITK